MYAIADVENEMQRLGFQEQWEAIIEHMGYLDKYTRASLMLNVMAGKTKCGLHPEADDLERSEWAVWNGAV